MWASLSCSCVRGDSEEDSNRTISFTICQLLFVGCIANLI
ncbi:hypothetical protein BDL97_17G064700 [Sphagnum fallax]|nr:hypothetical protein BDL97_17G064700 [Sphagnum fallax]